MSAAAKKWRTDLAAWAIPQNVLEQAPESPWIHPPEVFVVTGEIPDSPSHSRAREALPNGGSVLDVGCGGGRAALALADRAGLVIGIDHQAEMLQQFAAAARERGLAHEQVLGDWPEAADRTPLADVVVCHHVAYNVPELGAFLVRLNQHARHRVVLELPTAHPLTNMSTLWKHFWDIDRPITPTATDALAVALEVGLPAQLETWPDEDLTKRAPLARDKQAHFMRIRLCLPAEREAEVAAAMAWCEPSAPRESATLWWDV
ncbi:MAG: methyltransferase domain-containing protein [Actinomycetes bacterium]